MAKRSSRGPCTIGRGSKGRHQRERLVRHAPTAARHRPWQSATVPAACQRHDSEVVSHLVQEQATTSEVQPGAVWCRKCVRRPEQYAPRQARDNAHLTQDEHQRGRADPRWTKRNRTTASNSHHQESRRVPGDAGSHSRCDPIHQRRYARPAAEHHPGCIFPRRRATVFPPDGRRPDEPPAENREAQFCVSSLRHNQAWRSPAWAGAGLAPIMLKPWRGSTSTCLG